MGRIRGRESQNDPLYLICVWIAFGSKGKEKKEKGTFGFVRPLSRKRFIFAHAIFFVSAKIAQKRNAFGFTAVMDSEKRKGKKSLFSDGEKAHSVT